MPYISFFFQILSGGLLALLAGGFLRFPDGRTEAARSRARAFGFCVGVTSLFVCASGLTTPLEANEELRSWQVARYLSFASIGVWLGGLASGMRFRLGDVGRKYVGLLAFAFGTLWWTTRDGNISLEDFLLFGGMVALVLCFLVGDRRARLQQKSDSGGTE